MATKTKKTGKPTAAQAQNAVIAAALRRAADSLDTGGAAPEPGTWSVEVCVDVVGDVVIGEPTTAARCSISATTALACYALDAGEKIEDWAACGVELVRAQKRSKAGREALVEAVRRMDDAFRDAAEDAGFYSEATRAGRVTGKPVAVVRSGWVTG